MPDSITLGYFLELADEAESLIAGDALRERHKIVSYKIKEEKKALKPVLRPGSVMFVLPFPASGSSLLTAEEEKLFRAWWDKCLFLKEDGWSLTALLRTSDNWDRGLADRDKAALKEEMTLFKPRALVLFGQELAAYMTRRQDPMTSLVRREYSINHIKTYVTWSPADYLAKPELKRPIWDNLCYIRDRLK